MSTRRVVVTGLGAVTPLGSTVSGFWDGLISGRSGIRTVTAFDANQFDVHFGGECPDFDADKLIDHRLKKRMDRFTQLAFVAARMAINEAGVAGGAVNPYRKAVIIGVGIGGLMEIEDQHKKLLAKGPDRVSPFTIPKLMPNAASGHISIEFQCQGPSASVGTACASAGSAMYDAFHMIKTGLADVIVTGGTEAALTPLGLAAFAAMKALSTRNSDPAAASRPFDADRDGFVLSEGAGILIFEEYEHAKARNAPIYCEVLGVGATSDAGDMVQPDPEGSGGGRAMASALQSAGINPDQVDYINAHGTSTPLGDIAETKAIKKVFGPHARKLMVSSTKSAHGHTLGASGGIEAIACIQAIKHNTVPPTINLHKPDPQCDLDYVPNTARDAQVRIAMNNSFGFGGHNACIVFRKI